MGKYITSEGGAKWHVGLSLWGRWDKMEVECKHVRTFLDPNQLLRVLILLHFFPPVALLGASCRTSKQSSRNAATLPLRL
jgi:hypothetical protein